jgi:hypothetical protein
MFRYQEVNRPPAAKPMSEIDFFYRGGGSARGFYTRVVDTLTLDVDLRCGPCTAKTASGDLAPIKIEVRSSPPPSPHLTLDMHHSANWLAIPRPVFSLHVNGQHREARDII